MEDLELKANHWITCDPTMAHNLESELYCEHRDRFDVRLEVMSQLMLRKNVTNEETAYFIKSIAGEIGNNSFDHNVGNWPDVSGIFFGYDFSGHVKKIILADRGRGVLATLRRVRPELQNDEEALNTAFTERLSSRLPERRGNGLKFVRDSIALLRLHLDFFSGQAKAELNERMEIGKTQDMIRGCLATLTFSGMLKM